MSEKSSAQNGESPSEAAPASPPLWLTATLADVDGVDFEKAIEASVTADCHELSELFNDPRPAVEGEEAKPETPEVRVFAMLKAVTGMHFRPRARHEPYGAMMVLADGRRTPVPSDFGGDALGVLEALAVKATHPTLRARLSDVCWLLRRKNATLGAAAAAAYLEIVKGVDSGRLKYRFDEKNDGALRHDSRDLLIRALYIARGLGWSEDQAADLYATVTTLRKRALDKGLAIQAKWFSDLDLEFGISDPAEIGKEVETLIGAVSEKMDPHVALDLWRLAARAYHYAKRQGDANRCQSEAAEHLVKMAENGNSAMMSSSFLADAISELHGVPGKKDRRKELRHQLIDVQANIADEMGSFSHPMDLSDLIKELEGRLDRFTRLRDRLFLFASLDRSPDPKKLIEDAEKSIRDHPLSSLFASSYHDHEGKVVHRNDGGGGLGDSEDAGAVRSQILQHETLRRHITVASQIEVARRRIVQDHYVSDEVFRHLLDYSGFVPADLVRTFGRGFTCFFQGDYTSAIYILTPLLENSLRHVLKACGHDVTIFDDATQTQQGPHDLIAV